MLSLTHHGDLKLWWFSQPLNGNLKLFTDFLNYECFCCGEAGSGNCSEAPYAEIHSASYDIFDFIGYFVRHIHYCNFDSDYSFLSVYSQIFASSFSYLMDGFLSCCSRSSCLRNFLGGQLYGYGFQAHASIYNFHDFLDWVKAFWEQIG